MGYYSGLKPSESQVILEIELGRTFEISDYLDEDEEKYLKLGCIDFFKDKGNVYTRLHFVPKD